MLVLANFFFIIPKLTSKVDATTFTVVQNQNKSKVQTTTSPKFHSLHFLVPIRTPLQTIDAFDLIMGC